MMRKTIEFKSMKGSTFEKTLRKYEWYKIDKIRAKSGKVHVELSLDEDKILDTYGSVCRFVRSLKYVKDAIWMGSFHVYIEKGHAQEVVDVMNGLGFVHKFEKCENENVEYVKFKYQPYILMEE